METSPAAAATPDAAPDWSLDGRPVVEAGGRLILADGADGWCVHRRPLVPAGSSSAATVCGACSAAVAGAAAARGGGVRAGWSVSGRAAIEAGGRLIFVDSGGGRCVHHRTLSSGCEYCGAALAAVGSAAAREDAAAAREDAAELRRQAARLFERAEALEAKARLTRTRFAGQMVVAGLVAPGDLQRVVTMLEVEEWAPQAPGGDAARDERLDERLDARLADAGEAEILDDVQRLRGAAS